MANPLVSFCVKLFGRRPRPGGRVVSGMLYTGIEKVLVNGVNFVQGVVLARLLCPGDFGLAAMLGVFLGLGGVLADSGLGTALVISRGKNLARVERQVLVWNVGLALAIYALLAIAAPWIARWYGKPILAPMMWAMASGLVINAASVVATARLVREEKFGYMAWVNGLSAVAAAIVAIVLAWRGFGVWSIVWMGIASAVVRTALAWKFAPPASIAGQVPDDGFRGMLSYGWKLTVSGIIHTVYTESYNLVIGKMWSPTAVGLFARGNRWAKLPGEVVNESVGRVALPMMAKGTGVGDRGFKFMMVNGALLWPGLAVLWIWAPETVMFVLGEKWIDCVPYLRILVIGQFFTPIGGIALQKLRADGRSGGVLVTDVIKKPLGLFALVCGMPFGVVGLCWAKVASDAIEALVDVVVAWRGWCDHFRDTNVLYRFRKDLRPFLWRYMRLVLRADITPVSHPNTWCHCLVVLLECGKRELFQRVMDRFLSKGGDVRHLALYFKVAEEASLLGCREPEILRSANVWKALNGQHVSRRFEHFVKGKTVALVGNGPQEIGKGLGAEIDGHDVVIRINNYELAGYESDYGCRTDVWVKNVMPEMSHELRSPEIKVILYNGNWGRDRLEHGYLDHIERDVADARYATDYIDADDRCEIVEAINGNPTSGALVLNLLRKCGCARVDVYGCSYVDWHRGETYVRIPKDVSFEDQQKRFRWHTFEKEAEYLSRLLTGRMLRLS